MRHSDPAKATNAKRFDFIFALASTVGIISLTASCAGDQPKADSGAGGSATGGTATGGTATGGHSGTGSTGGNGGGSGGNSGKGGSAGSGGSAGKGGSAGGSTGNPDARIGDASPDQSTTDGMTKQDLANAGADALLADGGKDQQGSADVVPGDAIHGDAGPAAVQLVGRFDQYDSTPAKFGWSGSAMIARFNGTGVTIQLDGQDDRYAVLIDGTMSTVLKVTSSGAYEVAKDLALGTHDLVVYKRTEGNNANSSYLGLTVTGGQLLPPPARPDRRIEIYGDSITAGYGLDGPDQNCTATQDNANHYLTYGAVAARALSAELHTIAWSGIGMYRNYGQKDPPSDAITMPIAYGRIMPTPPWYPTIDNTWDFTTWHPHAVVINLGTNDASTNHDPGTPYRTAYLDFVRNLRKKYPDTFFILSIGPMLSDPELTAIREHLQAVIQTRAGEGDTKMSYLEFPTQTGADGYGCDWHPSAATNAKMADLLVAELKKQLSW